MNDKLIKYALGDEKLKIIYDNIMLINNCLKILRNKNDILISFQKNNIGSLIRLDCGHNGRYNELDERNFIHLLKEAKFIK